MKGINIYNDYILEKISIPRSREHPRNPGGRNLIADDCMTEDCFEVSDYMDTDEKKEHEEKEPNNVVENSIEVWNKELKESENIKEESITEDSDELKEAEDFIKEDEVQEQYGKYAGTAATQAAINAAKKAKEFAIRHGGKV